MANTMKFGNGQWATKKDSILAYNDENANFKPLPFTASRASTATVVNKAGLLETVASGIPRVDYLSNTSGAYLLEPSSTNLITQSEAFSNSYWTKSGVSIEGDASTAGSELAVNGDFSSNSDWFKPDMSTLINFQAGEGVLGSGEYAGQLGMNLFANKSYMVSVDAYKSGNAGFQLNTILGSWGSGIITHKNLSITTTKTTYSFLIHLNSDANGILIKEYFGSSGTLYIDNVSIKEVQGFASPSADTPLGAFKLVEGTSTGGHRFFNLSIVSSGIVTLSVNLKASERNWVSLREGYSASETWFNLSSGTIGTETNVIDSKIEALSDGWYKCSITVTLPASLAFFGVYLADADNSQSYLGNGTSGVYIFGAQLEQQSYATSYIPTAGSQITRLADSCSQTVPDGIINSSEGTLFVEMAALSDYGSYRLLSLNDGTTANRMYLGYVSASNTIESVLRVSSVTQSVLIYDVTNISKLETDNLKIAVRYKLNDFALFINGIKVGIDTTGNTFPANALNTLSFNSGSGGDNLEGKIKQLQVFNTALTDAELQTLTTI